MGWTGSRDMRRQVRLWFGTQEEAIAYAETNGIPFLLEEPKPATRKILSYSDNFKATRLGHGRIRAPPREAASSAGPVAQLDRAAAF